MNYMVRDTVVSTRFYMDVLGMAYIIGVKEGTQEGVPEFDGQTPLAFAQLKRGEAQVMLLSPSAMAESLPQMQGKAPFATGLLFVEVDNVDALFADIEGKAEVQVGLNDTFYGMREFTISDPDGYLICFAQRLVQ
jgi:uncharacterized glyoxalase superfamily protein PhnB